jgi:dihydrofolate synthase/folylpolyglutamate synthase
VIWETGLGGRLDATNIVTPLASVITNIGLDHQQWLGDTLEKIAAEKAGIIKFGVPVVTATEAPEALRVIEAIAQKNGSALTCVGKNSVSGIAYPAALLGDHQKINAALAQATVEVLQKQIPVSAESIRAGLTAVDWPGRLQLVTGSDGRKILLDGAHNTDGAKMLRAALEKHFPRQPVVLIFGALADKNWLDICRTLAPLAGEIFTVPVANARTADARDLANAFQTANPAATVVVCNHLQAALNACKDEGFIVVTGSLYLVGEALERLGLAPCGAGERGLNEWSAAALKR